MIPALDGSKHIGDLMLVTKKHALLLTALCAPGSRTSPRGTLLKAKVILVLELRRKVFPRSQLVPSRAGREISNDELNDLSLEEGDLSGNVKLGRNSRLGNILWVPNELRSIRGTKRLRNPPPLVQFFVTHDDTLGDSLQTEAKRKLHTENFTGVYVVDSTRDLSSVGHLALQYLLRRQRPASWLELNVEGGRGSRRSFPFVLGVQVTQIFESNPSHYGNVRVSDTKVDESRVEVNLGRLHLSADRHVLRPVIVLLALV
mmetsp:Transcript_10626/g.21846  ORF Transcript_10626/g.21846 Transcript_10626/m.21846 type:complete len:259 (+) Transcript_10626:1980-2756(+)